MATEFRTTRRVEFSRTDMAGIAHFASFFCWMEEAEHEYFRSLGFSVDSTQDGERTGWPRLSVSCDYHKPARFEEVLDVAVTVGKVGRKSLTLKYSFLRDGEEIANGQAVTICCKMKPDGTLESLPIPSDLRSKFVSEGD